MTKPLWTMPMAGYCEECAMPAIRLAVYAHGRAIVHAHGGTCWIANPPPTPYPMGQNVHHHEDRGAP